MAATDLRFVGDGELEVSEELGCFVQVWQEAIGLE